jgi:hypothetical protein
MSDLFFYLTKAILTDEIKFKIGDIIEFTNIPNCGKTFNFYNHQITQNIPYKIFRISSGNIYFKNELDLIVNIGHGVKLYQHINNITIKYNRERKIKELLNEI